MTRPFFISSVPSGRRIGPAGAGWKTSGKVDHPFIPVNPLSSSHSHPFVEPPEVIVEDPLPQLNWATVKPILILSMAHMVGRELGPHRLPFLEAVLTVGFSAAVLSFCGYFGYLVLVRVHLHLSDQGIFSRQGMVSTKHVPWEFTKGFSLTAAGTDGVRLKVFGENRKVLLECVISEKGRQNNLEAWQRLIQFMDRHMHRISEIALSSDEIDALNKRIRLAESSVDDGDRTLVELSARPPMAGIAPVVAVGFFWASIFEVTKHELPLAVLWGIVALMLAYEYLAARAIAITTDGIVQFGPSYRVVTPWANIQQIDSFGNEYTVQFHPSQGPQRDFKFSIYRQTPSRRRETRALLRLLAERNAVGLSEEEIADPDPLL